MGRCGSDAVAVALITPGPVVITTGFIGYLLAGLPGATVAAIATFLPAYLLCGGISARNRFERARKVG